MYQMIFFFFKTGYITSKQNSLTMISPVASDKAIK